VTLEKEIKLKSWIDSASYVELLKRWQFAPTGDPMFLGDVGKYYTHVMRRKRDQIGEDAHLAASKLIGWMV